MKQPVKFCSISFYWKTEAQNGRIVASIFRCRCLLPMQIRCMLWITARANPPRRQETFCKKALASPEVTSLIWSRLTCQHLMPLSSQVGLADSLILKLVPVLILPLLHLPGGFGVAKNLCDWAVKNKNYTIQPDTEKTIKAFHKAGKPLGMCCISPVLAAKILPGCELTVGHDQQCDKCVNPLVTVASPRANLNVQL